MRKFHVRALQGQGAAYLQQQIALVGATPRGVAVMADKGRIIALRVDGLGMPAANILKQTLLSCGGDVAVHKQTIVHGIEKTSAVILATPRQYTAVQAKLKLQQFSLPELAEEIAAVLANLEKRVWQVNCGKKGVLTLGERTLIMGILNVTPDSFSDGGRFHDPQSVLAAAQLMVEQGADIIDVGAESTRPDGNTVSAEEEWRRLQDVLPLLAQNISVPISVDTYKAEVARLALQNGADIINDVGGLLFDADMANVVAESGAPVIIMHNQQGTEYRDLLGDMLDSLNYSVELALAAGVRAEQIILDPGFGFGKTAEQNLASLRYLDDLATLGYPLLMGASRKSTLGKVLDLPAQQREEATMAVTALSIAKGAAIVRVHNVQDNLRVARLSDAVVRGNWHE